MKKKHPYKVEDISPIGCVSCGKEITAINPSDLDKYDLDSQMWSGGVVGIISAGYGSTNDGNVYFVGICDKCLDMANEKGNAVFLYDYMNNGEEINKNYRNEYNKILHRKIKLKRILGGCEKCGGEIEERDGCLICNECGLAKPSI
jgi:hypothetical protein